MVISGSGPVDGLILDMSSGRGESQSLTVGSIMGKLFCDHQVLPNPVTFIFDTHGVQKDSTLSVSIAIAFATTGIQMWTCISFNVLLHPHHPINTNGSNVT
jgi:hypothetical protein